MEIDRFDQFVRSLAASATRRLALGGLAGAGFLPLLGRQAGEKAGAKKKKKKKCRNGKKRCGKQCVNLATNAAHCGACGRVCPSGGCVHGACTCAVDEDCPGDCQCLFRLEGGKACTTGSGEPPCDGDEACPLGSFCVNVIEKCSQPCVG